MTRNPPAEKNSRSVVPLSLALLVFNVLGTGDSSPPSGASLQSALIERPEDLADPAKAPRRLC